MKILEIISDTNIGGAGRVLIERLEKSSLDGYDFAVLLPKGSALKERIEAINVSVFEFDSENTTLIFDLLRTCL